jgi:hypothetical protein
MRHNHTFITLLAASCLMACAIADRRTRVRVHSVNGETIARRPDKEVVFDSYKTLMRPETDTQEDARAVMEVICTSTAIRARRLAFAHRSATYGLGTTAIIFSTASIVTIATASAIQSDNISRALTAVGAGFGATGSAYGALLAFGNFNSRAVKHGDRAKAAKQASARASILWPPASDSSEAAVKEREVLLSDMVSHCIYNEYEVDVSLQELKDYLGKATANERAKATQESQEAEGAQGADGAQGAQGADGAGADGAGADGADGADGAKGAKEADRTQVAEGTGVITATSKQLDLRMR